MADKSYIELKLDPDKMKEELRGIIPGYRALEYFHNNPDSSFTNTLDLLAEDVIPFYAAYKYGAEPEDYIKEALLFGSPINAPAAKKQLSKFKPGTEFRNSGDDFVLAKEPGGRKAKEYYLDERGMTFTGQTHSLDLYNKLEDKPMSLSELDKSIDNTNAAHEKLPMLNLKNPVTIANEDIGHPQSGNLAKFNTGYGGKYNSLGNKIEAYEAIRRMFEQASLLKLNKGESIKVLMEEDGLLHRKPTVVIFDPLTNRYMYWYDTKHPHFITSDDVLIDLPDKNLFDADYKALQNDINVRNTRADFEDDVIPYIDFEQYKDQYNKAYNEYSDALYGPFLEDVIPNYRR